LIQVVGVTVRSVGLSSAIIATTQLPQTSAIEFTDASAALELD